MLLATPSVKAQNQTNNKVLKDIEHWKTIQVASNILLFWKQVMIQNLEVNSLSMENTNQKEKKISTLHLAHFTFVVYLTSLLFH